MRGRENASLLKWHLLGLERGAGGVLRDKVGLSPRGQDGHGPFFFGVESYFNWALSNAFTYAIA